MAICVNIYSMVEENVKKQEEIIAETYFDEMSGQLFAYNK